MYFRCTDCYAATWVHGVDVSGASHTLKCRGCGRGFTVRSSPNLDPDPREQHETALALAQGNDLDLPSAYSVLLGVMTLEGALQLRDRGIPAREVDPPASTPAPAAAAASTSSSTQVPVAEYDPAFAEAVSQGYLSVQQAIERGSRDQYAKRLVERHGLTEELAFLVADNKTSLSMAIRKDREEVAEVLKPVRRTVWKKAAVAILGGIAAMGVVAYGFYVWSGIEADDRRVEEWSQVASQKAELERRAAADAAPAREGPARNHRVRLLRDPDGRLLEIEAPDPRTILVAWCAHQEPAGRCRPVELTEAVPPFPGARLGIFADEADAGRRHAIRIRQSIKGRRWVAGDGLNPIEPTPAPELPPDARRTPVSDGDAEADGPLAGALNPAGSSGS